MSIFVWFVLFLQQFPEQIARVVVQFYNLCDSASFPNNKKKKTWSSTSIAYAQLGMWRAGPYIQP